MPGGEGGPGPAEMGMGDERISSLETINLPDDEGIRKALTEKHDEYGGRIIRVNSLTNPYKSPEQLEHYQRTVVDSFLKRSFVEALLISGKADPKEIRGITQAVLGDKFDPGLFGNAHAVIKDYIETGGKQVRGGTGIK
jgi:hypothetical protein